MQQLLDKFEGDEERCGFVLKSGEIVEVINICDKPTEGFDIAGVDLVRFTPIAAASWHTHPGMEGLLSMDDWTSFRNWPELDHYIIGTDGVTKYTVENGVVLIAS